MWIVFADVPTPTDPLSAIVAIFIGVLGSGGAGALLVKAWNKYSDNQKEIEIKRLEQRQLELERESRLEIERLNQEKMQREEVARQKSQEAEMRAAELAEMKAASQEIFARWKSIATKFEKENERIQERYEAKCVEVAMLKIQLAELQHGEGGAK